MQYDVSYAKEKVEYTTGEVKTYWPVIGRAFKDAHTGRITLSMDALPLPGWDGRLMLYPRAER